MKRTSTFSIRLTITAVAVLVFQTVAPFALANGQKQYNVLDFGASTQADRIETRAFQKAVDACHSGGGGVVEIPPGTYRIGRVLLRDNVAIHLEAGAVVRPSVDRTDYPAIAGAPDSNYQPQQAENALSCRFALFYAYRAKNVTIFGKGKLLGDANAFWKVKGTGKFPEWNTVAPQYYFTPRAFRPIMAIFENCTSVVVRDILIEDSPCYSVWFAGCRYTNITGVSVHNDLAGPNTDGFHFSSCRNVHVTDCDLVCGDDCIAIDPNHRGPASDFTITGCTFKTTVNVFRIYSGLDPGLPSNMPRGQVSNITASNCSVEDASGVFNITAERGDIQRIVFSNFAINMDYRGSAFFFLTIAGGGIRDVLLSNMTIRTDGAGVISGEHFGQIRNIRLDGLRYEICPRAKLYGNGMPDPTGCYSHHFAPYSLFIRHAEEVKLHDIQVDWGKADIAELAKVPGAKRSWSCIDCYDVAGLDIEAVRCSPFGADSSAILLNTIRQAVISGCRAQLGTKIFLQVTGQSEGITLMGNDLSKADIACQVSGDAAAGAVVEIGNRPKSAKHK